MSKTERLFVGNLPDGCSDQELRNEFSSYGSVKTVEVKTKTDPVNNQVSSTFAFITIAIDGSTLKQCLQEFRDEKYRGRFLTVSVARENFLDKLKREREEAAQLNGNRPAEIASPRPVRLEVAKLPVIDSKRDESGESSGSSESESSEEEVVKKSTKSIPVSINKRKSQSSSSGSTESESEDEDKLILRKKSKAFLENGKIKIDHLAGDPIHIIQKKGTQLVEKNFDDKAKAADQKRMESLNKMKDSYKQKQMMIKNALAQVNQQKSNKITFDTDQTPATKANKPALFDDDDDLDNETVEDFRKKLANRTEYQGKLGAKLQRLNLKYSGDRRFQMDSQFLDEDPAPIDATTAGSSELNEERQWQYGILESVVGHQLTKKQLESSGNADRKKTYQMLHYDPTQEEHAQLTPKTTTTTERKPKNKSNYGVEKEAVAVSKDQFHVVSDRLKSSLGGYTSGFSLTSMFGQHYEPEATDQKQSKDLYKSAVLQQVSNLKKPHQVNVVDNPFKYDSSEDDEDHASSVSSPSTQSKQTPIGSNDTANNKIKKSKLEHEAFFFHLSDKRLQDGLNFFMSIERPAEEDANVAQSKRQEMRNIIKKQMKRAIRKKLPQGAKPNRKFRRFARNL